MNRNELERAWPAAEPPPGFPERVVERARSGAALPERAPRRTGVLAWLSVRARWLPFPAAAAALAAAVLLWSAPPAREGAVIADEPRVVALGGRVVAELSRGAHLRWSGDEVRQERGDVSYRVRPGAGFRVQTPHGSVAVLGTVFRVIVAGEAAEGEPMNKRWAIAGTGAAVGALLWVSVEEGSVRLSRDRDELVLGAGQAGAIGADGVARLAVVTPTPAVVDGLSDASGERARARRVADAVRRHAARRREALRAAVQAPTATSQPSAEPAAPPVEFVLPSSSARPAPPATEEEARRRDYIRRTVREQYFPVARDCYDELLSRQPTASGRVVLEFAIVGNGDAGVVDRVALREDESTLDDPEFALCMRESLYTAVFEPPPPGTSETTVVYPVELLPN